MCVCVCVCACFCIFRELCFWGVLRAASAVPSRASSSPPRGAGRRPLSPLSPFSSSRVAPLRSPPRDNTHARTIPRDAPSSIHLAHATARASPEERERERRREEQSRQPVAKKRRTSASRAPSVSPPALPSRRERRKSARARATSTGEGCIAQPGAAAGARARAAARASESAPTPKRDLRTWAPDLPPRFLGSLSSRTPRTPLSPRNPPGALQHKLSQDGPPPQRRPRDAAGALGR